MAPFLLLLVFLLASGVSPASAEHAAMYIIHMDRSAMPDAFGGDHAAWYAASLATTASPGTAGTGIVYVYDNVIHGFSARLTGAQLDTLRRAPGFLACYRDRPVRPDTTHTPAFLGLSRSFGLWPSSGFGKDVIIGVVDTGVTPESRSFDDWGLSPVPARWRGHCESGTQFDAATACNRKLIGARKFNKGLLADNPGLKIAVDSPRDTRGHGTHTASTAAGSPVAGASFFGYSPGTAQGVAPASRIAVYKALWPDGPDQDGSSSDIIAAMDAAIADGVDVLSLSFGVDHVALYEDPTAIAAFSAVEKGIVVSASSGNLGPLPGSLHNGAPWVITVGAGTVDRDFTARLRLGDGTDIAGHSMYPGGDGDREYMPLADMGSCGDVTALEAVKHKMVLCSGDLDFAVTNVQLAGVTAGLFVSDDNTDIEEFIQFRFPAAIIYPDSAGALVHYINKTSNPTARLSFGGTVLGTRPAPAVAAYSSRGPSPASPAILKPDIIAPGSLILASWAENVSVGAVGEHALHGPFAVISGTSMSCPHVSGIAALLRAVHPDWSPAAVRSAMMTTASPLDNQQLPIRDAAETNGSPASPLAIGSGFVDPNRAADPGLIYDAGRDDYVKYLCAMNFTSNQIAAVTRSPPAAVNCSGATLDINYPSFIAYFSAGGKNCTAKRTFTRTVTNVGDGPAAYAARVEGMKGFEIRVEPERLEFERRRERRSFTVTVEGKMEKEGKVAHGALTWRHVAGKYVVRSPIVATTVSVTL